MQTKNSTFPGALTALTLLAVLLGASVASGQPRKAAENNNKPTDTQKLFQDGKKAMLTGDYDTAIKLLKQAVDAKDAKTSYRLYMARAYRYADKTKLAEAQLDIILKSAPDHVEAGQLLGQIYAERKDLSVSSMPGSARSSGLSVSSSSSGSGASSDTSS